MQDKKKKPKYVVVDTVNQTVCQQQLNYYYEAGYDIKFVVHNAVIMNRIDDSDL